MLITMQIIPLTTTHLPAAAALFTAALRRQRELTPALPAQLEDEGLVIQKLEWLLGAGPAFGALDAGELIGFLGTILVPHFRNTARKGAYVPEWGHAAAPGRTAAVYPALYRAAAAEWAEAGCQVHAISILAHDRAAVDQWFWQGFGLTVVDAVRPVQPLAASLPGLPPVSLTIRKATPADAALLAALDDEHCRHYTASPIFMAPPHQNDEAEFAAFLARPHNAAWLALDGVTPAGFLRFDGYEVDGVGILEGGAHRLYQRRLPAPGLPWAAPHAGHARCRPAGLCRPGLHLLRRQLRVLQPRGRPLLAALFRPRLLLAHAHSRNCLAVIDGRCHRRPLSSTAAKIEQKVNK